MVFCCIALVGIAIIYFCLLWLRQIFSWPKLDRAASALPGPPRALSGKGAQPVYGNTALFMDKGGDIGLEFDPQQRQIRWIDHDLFGFNRRLGECFAVFIWGQWRVVVKGPENCKRILESQELLDSWPWTPPIVLLGRCCFGFLGQDERTALKRLIGRCLSHKQVQVYAPAFGELAHKCLDEITAGQFKKRYVKQQARMKRRQTRVRSGGSTGTADRSHDLSERSSKRGRSASPSPHHRRISRGHRRVVSRGSSFRSRSASPMRSSDNGSNNMADVDTLERDEEDNATFGDQGEILFKVKWAALRSYTLDLMDGPVLNLNRWSTGTQEKVQEQEFSLPAFITTQPMTAAEDSDKAENKKPKKKKRQMEIPEERELMLLWMERMKNGIDVIKTTFGPEWMYIWILNEYGRALNARMKLQEIFAGHVHKVAELVPNVRHMDGHTEYDVTTQPIPILAVHENRMRQAEGILGDANIIPQFDDRRTLPNRPRSASAPNVYISATDSSDDDVVDQWKEQDEDVFNYSRPYHRQAAEYATALKELDLVVTPPDEQKVAKTESVSLPPIGSPGSTGPRRRARIESCPGPVRSSAPPCLGQQSLFGVVEKKECKLDAVLSPQETLKDLEQSSLPRMSKAQNKPKVLYRGWVDSDDEHETPKLSGDAIIKDFPSSGPCPRTSQPKQSILRLPLGNNSSRSRQPRGLAPQGSGEHSFFDDLHWMPEDTIDEMSPPFHGGSTLSTDSTVPMGTPGKASAAPFDIADDLLSTTSTAQMLEEMEAAKELDDPLTDSSVGQTNHNERLSGLNFGDLAPAPSDPTHKRQHMWTSQTDIGASFARNDHHESVRVTTSTRMSIDHGLLDSPHRPDFIPAVIHDRNHRKTSLEGGNHIRRNVIPVLERIMRQHDLAGNGISKVVATELSLVLWMMMDMGNAWTAMALSLLSTDHEACLLVQEELDCLEVEFGGESSLFLPHVLNRMKYLDALIYEAIRLCPSNLGGMKKTTQTVENDGVQIPKGTNIFFCQPTSLKFDIRGALGKKPERLGRRYPCVELHGFLPLHGLEVPLMVLQTKAFLVSLLPKFTPSLSLKKNFIRRVRAKVRHSIYNFRRHQSDASAESNVDYLGASIHSQQSADQVPPPKSPFSDLEASARTPAVDVSQREAMNLFTKTPFPEPRRVIHLRPRVYD